MRRSLSPKILGLIALFGGLSAAQASAQDVRSSVSSVDGGVNFSHGLALGDIRAMNPSNSLFNPGRISLTDFSSLNSDKALQLEAMHGLASNPNLINVLLDPQGPLNPATFDPNNPLDVAAHNLANSLTTALKNPNDDGALRLDSTLQNVDPNLAGDAESQLRNRFNEVRQNPELRQKLENLGKVLQNINSQAEAGNSFYDGSANQTGEIPVIASRYSDSLVQTPITHLLPNRLQPASLEKTDPGAPAVANLPWVTLKVNDAAKTFQDIRRESMNERDFNGLVQSYPTLNPALTLRVDQNNPPQLLKLLLPQNTWETPRGFVLALADSKHPLPVNTLPILIISSPKNSSTFELRRIISQAMASAASPRDLAKLRPSGRVSLMTIQPLTPATHHYGSASLHHVARRHNSRSRHSPAVTLFSVTP